MGVTSIVLYILLFSVALYLINMPFLLVASWRVKLKRALCALAAAVALVIAFDVAATPEGILLKFAARSGYTGIARQAFRWQWVKNVDATTTGRTALMGAARWGRLDVAKFLLEKGADANAVDKTGKTALMEAAQHGHADVVRLLLDSGADAGAVKKDGMTALEYAVAENHLDIAKLVLDEGKLNADYINAKLLGEAWKGKINLRLICFWISRGADVNVRNQNGWAALHQMALHGNEGGTRILLGAKADVNVMTRGRETALILAARRGNAGIVRLLLEKGAREDVAQYNGLTALGVALFPKRSLDNDTIELLLKNKAVAEQTLAGLPIAGDGSLMIDALKFLVNRGVNVNAPNSAGWTALHNAAHHGREGVARFLLEAKADINVVNKEGETALMLAAKGGRTAVVKLLLDKGADADALDNAGNTALQKAQARKHKDVVRLLADKTAKTESKNN